MKILGLMLTYNNFHFLKHSLKQALDFCDELIVIDGSHLEKHPKHSTDGTCEYLQTIDNPKLKIIEDFDIKGRNDIVQCKLRETYAKQSSYWEPGNWICQWDDDIAFLNEDLSKIKEIMKKTRRDMIRFKERRFIYNFKFNTFSNEVGTYHFDRITEGCYYKPTWKLHYKNGKRYTKYKFLKNITYFHYQYVKIPERIMIRLECSFEKGYSNVFERFEKFLSVKWENDEDIYNYKDVIEDFVVDHGFNIYNGTHPEIMEDHVWRHIKDCRKMLKSENNF